jgi:hypothetical protein
MSISRFNKTLATLGMLLFFVLAGFAVSLAHDSPPTGLVPLNELRSASRHGLAQVDSYTLRVGMDAETGALPNFSQPVLQEFKIVYLHHHLGPMIAPGLTQPQAARVPLQILDSVLLF